MQMEDKDIIQLFLEDQEWQTFECKRAAIRPSDLLETVISFANADQIVCYLFFLIFIKWNIGIPSVNTLMRNLKLQIKKLEKLPVLGTQ